tara:strand:- start:12241 stop:12468 length:228 start_codon:yes stop_codon:yes gene_type:complete
MLNENPDPAPMPSAPPSLAARVLRIEWLGQTTASVCWIISVFAYDDWSAGEYLQLCAASAWFIANMSTLVPRHHD